MNQGDDYTLFAQHALSSMSSGDYYTLYNILRSICIAEEDKETLERLEQIKKGMPIDFSRFQAYFNKSHFKDTRRRIIFKDIGKVKYELVPILWERHVAEPLGFIAVEILGNISKSQSSVLKKFIKSKADEIRSSDIDMEPKIILE